MNMYHVEVIETRRYTAVIVRPSQQDAEQSAHELLPDLTPQAVEITVEALPLINCDACEETHFGPPCRKPPSRELDPSMPIDERRAL
jgi:hypothetical protein